MRRIVDGIQVWKQKVTNTASHTSSCGVTQFTLKLGTEHFLPALNTQEEKAEGKGNANKCWQLLSRLALCLSFWKPEQKVLTELWCLGESGVSQGKLSVIYAS